ncbi:MAG: hypothetical protein AAF492_22640, partial [Verrucomicrobiota bacterium]
HDESGENGKTDGVASSSNDPFGPFDAGKWFTIGFAAWLVLLTHGENVASQVLSNVLSLIDNPGGLEKAVAEKLVFVILLFVVLMLIGLVITIALQWVSSRAQFVFLDQVTHNRKEIAPAWKTYRAEGQSLFVWQVGFLVLLFLFAFIIFGVGIGLGWTSVRAGALGPDAWRAGLVVSLLFSLLALVGLFIQHLVYNYIVPIMYRRHIDAFAAWRVFLPWLKQYVGRFLLFAYLVFIIRATIMSLVVLLGFATLCCGLLLLSIPYVNVVVLLPYHILFRAAGPEFLARFSPDLDPFSENQDPGS